MILVIDVGNTHIEIGLYNQTHYINSWRITTGAHRTEDELMSYIYNFLTFQKLSIEKISAISISSVVPHVTQILCNLSEKYFRISPLIVDDTLDLGIRVCYDPPSSVGADRLCNAVAAFEKYGGPIIVVDFGTATTLDVVSRAGEYLGGAIAPGLETTSWGLSEKASKLPQITLEFPSVAIGRTTEESMQSGIMLGSVKMIDGLIELMQEEIEGEPHVIATGGLAKLIAPHSQYIKHVEPTLVLEGLVKIYWRNHRLRE